MNTVSPRVSAGLIRAIALSMLVVATVVSAASLGAALSRGIAEDAREWGTYLALFAVGLVVGSVVWIVPRIPARIHGVVADLRGAKASLVVAGFEISNSSGSRRRNVYFSSCLVATASGLELWRPFRSQKVAMERVSGIEQVWLFDARARRPGLRVMLKDPEDIWELMPQSSRFLEDDWKSSAKIESNLRTLRNLVSKPGREPGDST